MVHFPAQFSSYQFCPCDILPGSKLVQIHLLVNLLEITGNPELTCLGVFN